MKCVLIFFKIYEICFGKGFPERVFSVFSLFIFSILSLLS